MASFKNNQNDVWEGEKLKNYLGGKVEGVGEDWKRL